jgi:uncharacterized protein (TIGR02266 family)
VTKDHSRRFGRVPVSFEVRYRTAGAFLVAYTTNLSKGGLFIETPTPLPVGTGIALALSAPTIPEPLQVEGVVAWVRDGADPEGYPAGMGVQFAQIEERYGAVIDAIVSAFEGLRILVALASSSGRALIVRYLKSIITAQVIEAIDAETAMTALESRVDLCLVDLDDGPEAERTLLAARERPDHSIPVIALGANELTRERARALGADETIAAPAVFTALQTAVIRCLAKPAAIT